MEKELITVDVSDLVPYDNNPRINDSAVPAVEESIRQCGYITPIVVDEDMRILAGHTRCKALKSIGGGQVQVLVCRGLTDEQKRKFRLLDNKTSEFADWDFGKLEEELDGLDFGDFDFDWGLEGEESEEAQEDDYEERIPEEPVARLGDIYQLGRHRLMCGDSTSAEDVAKLMGGIQADVLLTDPPYGVSYQGKTADALEIENDSLAGEEFIEFLTAAFKAADSNMKPGAVFYIWHADSAGYEFRYSCMLTGWKVRECLIWAKNSMVLGRQDYQWKHEPCLYGWKDGTHHWYSDRKQTTVLEFDKPNRNGIHPTMKPIPLFDYQIKNSSAKGGNVLDLFGGSGTTMMACEQNGRNAFLMELDPKYCDAIIARWEEFTGKKAVLING